MSQETRTFHIDGSDYSFNFSAFRRFFKSYRAGTKRNITETEQAIADALSLSREAVHSWRFEKNGPSDIEVIKSLAEFLKIDDYRILQKQSRSFRHSHRTPYSCREASCKYLSRLFRFPRL